MSPHIVKRFAGLPPLRLFVFNNWRKGREDHDTFLSGTGAKFIGPAWVDGWAMYSVYANNSVILKELAKSQVNGELYAISQRGMMWCDSRVALGVDRVNVHLHYTIPERTELPTGGFVIEKAHGAKGVETAWLHFYARVLPFDAKLLNSLYDLDDNDTQMGVCC